MNIYGRLENPSLLSDRSRGGFAPDVEGAPVHVWLQHPDVAGARGRKAVLRFWGGAHLQTNLTIGWKSASDFLGGSQGLCFGVRVEWTFLLKNGNLLMLFLEVDRHFWGFDLGHRVPAQIHLFSSSFFHFFFERFKEQSCVGIFSLKILMLFFYNQKYFLEDNV